MKIKRVKIVAASVLMLLMGICPTVGALPPNETCIVEAAAKPQISKKSLVLEIGKTAALKMKNIGKNKVKWNSKNRKIATVSSKGVVTAKAVGKTKIIAETDGKKYSCKVSVKPIEVTGIKLNKETLSLKEGASYKLKASIQPQNASDKAVSWDSDDASVATVSDGVVTAIAEGTATITARSSNDMTASCEVSVSKPQASEVILSETSVTLKEGQNHTLTATVKPENAKDKTVTWSSDNASVATVSDGIITARREGMALITAKTVNNKEATCLVAVEAIEVDSVSISENSLTLKEGETHTLSASVLPENASDKRITWSSDNSLVATVSEGVVTAKKEGTATITAMAENGKKATCLVTVKPVEVSAVSISNTDLSLSEGDTYELTASVLPENASNKSITWSSDNTTVATVSKGIITAKSAGTATITASASNGVKAQCVVTVKSGLNITLPDTPLSRSSYRSNGDIEQTYTLTNIRIETKYYSYSSGYKVTLYCSGTKDYDYRGSKQSAALKIGWKLYNSSGAVVESGTMYTSQLAEGETFADSSDYISYGLSKGDYRIEILNVN